MSRARAVVDCNVLLQASLSTSGPSAQVLDLMARNLFDLQLSRAILKELRGVLNYPSVRARNPDMTDVAADEFVTWLSIRGIVLRRVPRRFNYPRDRRDEPYLDLALASQADYLVTRDNDLLDLMTEHSGFAKRFRQMTRPLKILTPPEFLRIMSRMK